MTNAETWDKVAEWWDDEQSRGVHRQAEQWADMLLKIARRAAEFGWGAEWDRATFDLARRSPLQLSEAAKSDATLVLRVWAAADMVSENTPSAMAVWVAMLHAEFGSAPRPDNNAKPAEDPCLP